jgi:hypothetical protein
MAVEKPFYWRNFLGERHMTNEELEDLLYAISMESYTAWRNMKAICEKLGVNYPPEPKK